MGPFELDSIRKLSRAPASHPWIESGIILSLFFGVGVLVRPEDPLFAEQVFPWSIFAPVLTGLRYGFAHGFVTAVVLHGLAAVYGVLVPAALWPLPFAYTLGLLLCSLIVGEFRDIWEQRLVQLERSNEYRQARMEEFTRSYHVLKISHDELEQEYAGRSGTSLRSALLTAREKLADAGPEDVGTALLDLLANFNSARSASYHPVRHGVVDPVPAARIGSAYGLAADDALLRQALERAATVSIRPEDTSSMAVRDEGDPIVVIPVVDAYREVRAVVSITQIPFFALTERNLQIATIVASRFGDFLHARERLPVVAGRRPAMYWFLYQTLRCLDLTRHHGLASCLLVCHFREPTQAPLYIRTIVDQARGLDEALPVEENGEWYLLMLMPLTTRAGLDRFMLRFDAYLTEHHSIGLGKAGIEVAQHVLESDTGLPELVDFLNRELGTGSRVSGFLATLGLEVDADEEEEARRAAAGTR